MKTQSCLKRKKEEMKSGARVFFYVTLQENRTTLVENSRKRIFRRNPILFLPVTASRQSESCFAHDLREGSATATTNRRQIKLNPNPENN